MSGFSRISLFLMVMAILLLYSCAQAPISVVSIWQKAFGGSDWDVAYSIRQTTDGGYIVAGYTTSFGAGEEDVYVLKLDADGNKLWEKTFGGTLDDMADSIQQTTDGGYIVAGYTTSFEGEGHVYVLKLDAGGNKLWEKTFAGIYADRARSVQQTRDGGYIVAGFTNSFGAGGDDVYILKLDASGDLEWEKTFGGTLDDMADSVQQTRDDGYIVAGHTCSFASSDVYVIKLNADGYEEWYRVIGDEHYYESANCIQLTGDGGYIIAGYTASETGWRDFYILKLDASGDLEWEKTFGGDRDDEAYSIQQTSDGGYIVAGYTTSFGAGEEDVYVLKLDADGNKLWEKTFGGEYSDEAYSIQQTNDEGYIVAGYTESFGAGSRDVYVLKLDKYGNTGPDPQ